MTNLNFNNSAASGRDCFLIRFRLREASSRGRRPKGSETPLPFGIPSVPPRGQAPEIFTLKALGSQQGFTLIELIVVIVVLGILAAVAVPKYLNVASSARSAAVNGIAGAIYGSMNLASAAANIANVTGATGTVSMSGTTINVMQGAGGTAAAYYPTAEAAGIVAALNTQSLPTPTYTGTGTAGTATFMPTGGNATCSVVYTTAVGTNPTVTVTTTGC